VSKRTIWRPGHPRRKKDIVLWFIARFLSPPSAVLHRTRASSRCFVVVQKSNLQPWTDCQRPTLLALSIVFELSHSSAVPARHRAVTLMLWFLQTWLKRRQPRESISPVDSALVDVVSVSCPQHHPVNFLQICAPLRPCPTPCHSSASSTCFCQMEASCLAFPKRRPRLGSQHSHVHRARTTHTTCLGQ
jgi:hypothetical protein